MSSIKIKAMSLEEARQLGIDKWGIWECEPSTFDWEYSEQEAAFVFEVAHIKENMLVSFPKGMKCTWEVKKAIRKAYTFNYEI